MIAKPSIIQRKFGLNTDKASALPVRTICVDADEVPCSNSYDAIVREAVLRAKQRQSILDDRSGGWAVEVLGKDMSGYAGDLNGSAQH
jgi:hypothetical protein